jgi:hypothetical protein
LLHWQWPRAPFWVTSSSALLKVGLPCANPGIQRNRNTTINLAELRADDVAASSGQLEIFLCLLAFGAAILHLWLLMAKQKVGERRILRILVMYSLYMGVYFLTGYYGCNNTVAWLAVLQDVARVDFLLRLLSFPNHFISCKTAPAVLAMHILCALQLLSEAPLNNQLPVEAADTSAVTSFFFSFSFYVVAAACCLLAVGASASNQALFSALAFGKRSSPLWLLSSLSLLGLATSAFMIADATKPLVLMV